MSKRGKNLWAGLNAAAQAALVARDYKAGSFPQRLAHSGVDAGELAAVDRRKPEIKKTWIPGVEIFSRTIHSQPHRVVFGEFVRRDEEILGKIGLWPKQWATARMFARSAKGFHIHPLSIPAETTAQKWLRRLFVTDPSN